MIIFKCIIWKYDSVNGADCWSRLFGSIRTRANRILCPRIFFHFFMKIKSENCSSFWCKFVSILKINVALLHHLIWAFFILKIILFTCQYLPTVITHRRQHKWAYGIHFETWNKENIEGVFLFGMFRRIIRRWLIDWLPTPTLLRVSGHT